MTLVPIDKDLWKVLSWHCVSQWYVIQGHQWQSSFLLLYRDNKPTPLAGVMSNKDEPVVVEEELQSQLRNSRDIWSKYGQPRSNDSKREEVARKAGVVFDLWLLTMTVNGSMMSKLRCRNVSAALPHIRMPRCHESILQITQTTQISFEMVSASLSSHAR